MTTLMPDQHYALWRPGATERIGAWSEAAWEGWPERWFRMLARRVLADGHTVIVFTQCKLRLSGARRPGTALLDASYGAGSRCRDARSLFLRALTPFNHTILISRTAPQICFFRGPHGRPAAGIHRRDARDARSAGEIVAWRRILRTASGSMIFRFCAHGEGKLRLSRPAAVPAGSAMLPRTCWPRCARAGRPIAGWSTRCSRWSTGSASRQLIESGTSPDDSCMTICWLPRRSRRRGNRACRPDRQPRAPSRSVRPANVDLLDPDDVRHVDMVPARNELARRLNGEIDPAIEAALERPLPSPGEMRDTVTHPHAEDRRALSALPRMVCAINGGGVGQSGDAQIDGSDVDSTR